VKQLQQIMLAKNRENEEESKRARQFRLESLQAKKKGGVIDMLMEKKYLTQMMIHEQEKEIQMKQKRRMEIKRMEEEARVRKEQERIEKEQKVKEYYAQKLAEEAAEAKRAEKLVKELEKKEREWIARLREAQTVQEQAFDQLETALHKDAEETTGAPGSTGKLRGSQSQSPTQRFKSSGGSHGGGDDRESAMETREPFRPGREYATEGDSLSQAMSDMNMSDPVDAVENAERVHKERAHKEGATKMRASANGSLEGSGVSGITRSSTGSARGASAGKKKPVASSGVRKAH
jgi:DNA polymerase III alpha subunit (gram-positive type)